MSHCYGDDCHASEGTSSCNCECEECWPEGPPHVWHSSCECYDELAAEVDALQEKLVATERDRDRIKALLGESKRARDYVRARAEIAEDAIAFAREYTGFEARPCPLCVYKEGVFQRRCSLHEQIDEARAEADAAQDAVASLIGLLVTIDRELQDSIDCGGGFSASTQEDIRAAIKRNK